MKHLEELNQLGLSKVQNAFWNLEASELIQKTILLGQGQLTDQGALACDTGKFTGRSPKDKYVVEDANTVGTIWWGEVNNKFSLDDFIRLQDRMKAFLMGKDIYIKDVFACASEKYKLSVRIISEYPWQNLFAHNLFLRPDKKELENFKADWTIICVSGFSADPKIDRTRAGNFTIINFTLKTILIGGSAYTGEIKKGIFTVLNYILPKEQNALSMHCSANIGEKGDTAIFFGLSGTGKTTLSADPNRKLIGDDEHGWDENSVFNFEGGCYAKCVNLSAEKEPQIFKAVRFGTLLENVNFYENSKTVDYDNVEKTENTRAAYPIHFIDNAVSPSIGKTPENIFFLTCDAFGVLPPISQLTKSQAMYHFISGYTAKIAGTEAGITEPQSTFSACFGKPFLALHPMKYAEMLGKKLEESRAKVWLINTGWTGGAYGVGERISLKYTRAMISAVLDGSLDKVVYTNHEIFGVKIPTSCPNVPQEILNPKNTWSNKNEYDEKAYDLANQFSANMENYCDDSSIDILAGGPLKLKTI